MNSSRMNKLEELGRVDSDKDYTKKCKRILKDKKKKIEKKIEKNEKKLRNKRAKWCKCIFLKMLS